MHAVWQDFRYGLRGLVNRPGFTVLAVLTLALGVGAATTIFSVIYNVMLDPFPYIDARRVGSIQIRDATSTRPGGRTFFQIPEFLEYQEQNHVFEDVIGGSMEDVLMTTAEGTEQLTGGMTTPNTFDFLGVPAVIGRTFTPDDARPDAPPVFVMAYKMWAKHFNLDPTVVGKTFTLNGVPTTVIGIMPQRFTKLAADLWRPVVLNRADPALKGRFFMFQARLKPGVTLEQAAADVDVIARRVAQQHASLYPKQFTVTVVSWVDSIVGPFKKTLYTLAAAVGLLLAISCFNVANMLLALATGREKEMAIRAALGAGRRHLVRQLLIESLLLGAIGAAIGCLVAYGGTKGIAALIPEGYIPREAVIRLNVPVLLFSLAAAVVTAIVFGLVPAMHAARRNVVESLKDSGKGVGAGFRRNWLRNGLVVVEIALSLTLLTGAGLLMRSFIALQNVELGLNPDNILVARLPLPRGQYDTAAAKQQFFQKLLPRLKALPGVVDATETSTLPPYGGIGSEIEIPGKTPTERWDAIFQLCSEGYQPTLGLRLLRGRFLSEVEVNAARRVAVVNQTFVNKYFGPEDPLGRQVRLKQLETLPTGRVENALFEIIGVISDAKNRGIQEAPGPEVFIPYTVTGAFERGILVRSQRAPEALLNSVRKEIWSVDRGVALTMTGTLTGYLKQFSYAEPRFSLVVLGIFASVGLVLVAMGIFSVIAYAVSQHTHEIGIRMALGATQGNVLKMVTIVGLRLIALGVILGLTASYFAIRLIGNQIWGIPRYDPLTLTAVVAAMVIVGLAACFFPARRATSIDPLVALRIQ
jgi:putative ABC transport system permease protein